MGASLRETGSRPTDGAQEVSTLTGFNPARTRRYRCAPRCVSGQYVAGLWVHPGADDGQFVIYGEGHILMRGRTFNRETADDICDALETAFEAGQEDGVEA